MRISDWSSDVCSSDLAMLIELLHRRLSTPEVIKSMAWLNTNWDIVAAKKITPPFVPQFESETDLHYFDDFEALESFEIALQRQSEVASLDNNDTIDHPLFKDF